MEAKEFSALRVSLASPENIRSWSYGEVTKPSIIAGCGQRKTGFSVKRSLAQHAIGSVIAASIRTSVIAASNATNVVWK